jgi:hypothetical protein
MVGFYNPNEKITNKVLYTTKREKLRPDSEDSLHRENEQLKDQINAC